MNRPSNAQIQAKQTSCYYPGFKNIDQVCKFMKDYKHIDGSFLLRNSFSKPGAITVTVWHQKRTRSSGLKHFTIKTHKDGFYLQDDLFSSMEKLIDFYTKCEDIPNEEGLKGFRLTRPIINHEYEEIPSEDGYEEFVRRASPPLPPRKVSLDTGLLNLRLSTGSDSSGDSAFSTGDPDNVQLPVSSKKKGFFSDNKKRNKSTGDLPGGKLRPLPPPPRMTVS